MAIVEFHHPSLAICRRIARAGGGAASLMDRFLLADVMERIKSRTRTHGRR
jgi:hypothetical protein